MYLNWSFSLSRSLWRQVLLTWQREVRLRDVRCQVVAYVAEKGISSSSPVASPPIVVGNFSDQASGSVSSECDCRCVVWRCVAFPHGYRYWNFSGRVNGNFLVLLAFEWAEKKGGCNRVDMRRDAHNRAMAVKMKLKTGNIKLLCLTTDALVASCILSWWVPSRT